MENSTLKFVLYILLSNLKILVLVQCQPSSTVLISFPDLKRLIELLHEGQNIAIILCLLRKGHSKFSVIFKFSIMEPGFSKVSGDCMNTQTFLERK